MRAAFLAVVLLGLSTPALAGPPRPGARPARARILAEPKVLDVGELVPGQQVQLRLHLTNSGGTDATGVVCAGPGFEFPAVDVPAGGAVDVAGSYTAPRAPAPRKARPFVARARCDRAGVQLKGRSIPCTAERCLLVSSRVSPFRAGVGEALDVTLWVENRAPATFAGVRLRATAPAGVKVRDRTDGPAVGWELGEVPARERREIKFSVEGTAPGAHEITWDLAVGDRTVSHGTVRLQVIGAATPAGATPVTGAALLGTWRVQAMTSGTDRTVMPEGMKLAMEFQQNGVLVMHMTFGDQTSDDRVTWEATDRVLKVTSESGKVDEMEYTVTGTRLRLRDRQSGDTVEAVR